MNAKNQEAEGVAVALAPREQSPELVEAEVTIRGGRGTSYAWLAGPTACKAIAAELDRLRALVATLEAAASEAEQRGRRQADEAISLLNHGIDRHRQPDGAACSCGGCVCMQSAIRVLRANREEGKPHDQD